ncbi:hypothetical protein J8L73_17370 [Pseudoalteromonas sp. MMG006]|uniref:hypothetical protein n=1 Tax=Pseudoalteromonas sp. MMG006 TaxID=2822683 RepID=UPI001B36A025|nr:hypothetical protein [Pseudoalteromonas sp. MMG006]MBQ4800870.1 hypothetical protein [Pseudoalteromonas sp. MMG006]
MANEIATWLNKGYAEKLVKAATGYWSQTRNYVMWAVQQKDELQNEEPILGMLAWERLTTRLPNEPTELYRKRVQHALVNTIDAGEMTSLKRIFKRLNLEVINVRERIGGRDWDIIAIDMSDTTLANANLLLPELIQLYGRTCRRYELTVHSKTSIMLGLDSLFIQHDHTNINNPTQIAAKTKPQSQLKLGTLIVQHDHINILNPTKIASKTHLDSKAQYGFINKVSGISIAKEAT